MHYECCFFCILRRLPRSTRTDTRFPYTTLFRSKRSQDAASMRGDLLAYEVNGLVAPDHTLMLHFRSNPVVAAEMLTFRSRGDRSGCQDRKSTRLNSSH